MRLSLYFKLFIILILFPIIKINAQSDTIKVMTYNVLNYGDQCQGNNALIHNYLKTIVADVKPDILGMVKMASIKLSPTDINNFSPYGFPDSIINAALNPGTLKSFSYCPFKNISGDDKTSVLFYNNNKLGYISTTLMSSLVSDFNLYKLFYKDPHLSTTKDTTFLYVVLNHTQSGTDATTRNQQESAVLSNIKKLFYRLPNLVMMGDFNLHNSSEQFYQNYIASSDNNFLFFDPPFSIDNQLSYPADWDNNPNAFASYLTTSTRQSASFPNTCGTNGGAKSWYDHILISPWIKNNSNYITYKSNSYTTIGNDGKRVGISINDSTTAGIGKNLSVTSQVANALFQLSNKYPIAVELVLNYNTTGQSPVDPVTEIYSPENVKEFDIRVQNPTAEKLNIKIDLPARRVEGVSDFILTNLEGHTVWKTNAALDNELLFNLPHLPQGIYLLEILNARFMYHLKVVIN